MKALTLTHSSFKGGTGKTTLNTLTAEILASMGKKVLIIDLDPNCSISQVYGKVLQDRTSKDLITIGKTEPYTITENIDIIPGDLDMATMSNIMDTTLKHALVTNYLDKYDWIIIDPPGNWCAQTRNAIFASDILVIPGTVSALDVSATQKYIQQLQKCFIQSEVYIVCNKSNSQLNQPGILDQYFELFEDYMVKTPMPDIKSLKKLITDRSYPIHSSLKNKMVQYVQTITNTLGGE